MGILSLFSQPIATPGGLSADLLEDFHLSIDLLEDWMVRIAVVPREGLAVDRTWMVAPKGEVPWEGRDRLSKDGFGCPEVKPTAGGFEGNSLAVRVEQNPLRITVLQKEKDEWFPLFEDRQGGAWQWFEQGGHLKHFQKLEPDTQHFGLGDKTGKLDRSGRRLRCLQSDALGYNAETSDPLYKHAPWMMALRNGEGGGLLYDTMAEITFDLGAEHSNYFSRYRHVETQEKGIVLYCIAGPRLRDLVPRLHTLTGKVALPPRWAAGFAFTTMHHADSDNAQEVITNFAKEARERRLPISAIHLGSGYTAGEDSLRYVFNWNTKRFPDKKKFFAGLREMGFRTCANIKPVLLTGHKSFQQAHSQGWFVRRSDGDAAIEMFWGGQGASLDFTNQHAISFWQAGVAKQVLDAGFDAVWNDNNEAELWDETATLNGFGTPLPAMQSRPVHALLMTRASYEAMVRHNPDERPYAISRAGPIGIGRYGETWSGDNRTSWHTLKWNLRQGLSMSLSGMPLVGHDIGGFDGPPPEPELLVRWFQLMALHPRCVMNSWKVDFDNIPNLPWMHEAVFGHIKVALALRYRFLPALYALMHTAHETGHPVISPTCYHFDDPQAREDFDTFMLGPNVLVAPVVERGADRVSLYLPECEAGWVNYHSREILTGGQWVEVEAPIDQLPLFVRGNSVLPLATKWSDQSPHDPVEIQLTAFSGNGHAERSGWFFWDDGLSPDTSAGHKRIHYSATFNNEMAEVEAGVSKVCGTEIRTA